MKRWTYRVVNFRGWPGIGGWRPPMASDPYYPRLGDRVGLVIVAAADLGTVPERFGLGAYLVVSGRSVLDAGLIVPDGLDQRDRDLEDWAATQVVRTPSGPKRWSVATVSEFFDPYSGTFAKRAYTGAGWCIGADLGRVFGLMAEHVVPRKGPNRDSWDLWMPGWGTRGERGNVHRVSPHRPCLQVESRRVGWQVSFGPCRRENGKRVGGRAWPGAFIDVLSLSYALDADRGASFPEHRDNFGLDPVDLPVAVTVDATGAETMATAVQAIHELVLTLDDWASRWFTTGRDRAESRGRLDLARTVSPGGIATQVLSRFGARAPHETFGLSEPELHAWAETFHGGWCEADPRLLGVPFPAVSLDVAGCFPLVAGLIGWWDLVCAERVVKRKVTGALRRLCRKAIDDPGVLLDPVVWSKFGCCLVRVIPDGEVFPVEVEDHHRPDGRLEFLPLSSPDRPIWVCAFDVLVAAVKSKRVPEIIEATAYLREGRQAGIKRRLPLLPELVADGVEGPGRPIVEHRRKLKGEGDLATAAELRVVVNALVFGNFSRMDDLWVKDGHAWARGERPGPYICLPIASSVTAGSHLLLAILERLVMDKGGIVAYRDTDSSIIPSTPMGGVITLVTGDTINTLSWDDIDGVIHAFHILSPGEVKWTCAKGERSTPMRALIFGPKRHVEWVGEEIVDLTETGLGGTYIDPPLLRGRNTTGYRLWSVYAVEREMDLVRTHGVDSDGIRSHAPWDMPDKPPFPALRRLMVKTPEMAKLLPPCLGARPGTRYVEVSGAITSGKSFGRTVVALDPGGDLSDWGDLYWVDKATGVPVNVTTDPEDLDAVVLETLDSRAIEWSRKPRSEPIQSVVIDPDLVAYPGHVSGVVDADEDGLGDLESRRPMHRPADRLAAVQKEARRLRKRAFATRTGLPPTVAERAARGLPISERNVALALKALRAGECTERLCGLPGCNLPISRANADYCSKRHRDAAYRERRRPCAAERESPADPLCSGCRAILAGSATTGPCPVCSTVNGDDSK